MKITAEELLAGANMTYEVVIPENLLYSEGGDSYSENQKQEIKSVEIKPITIGVFHLIMKAAKNDPSLIPLLMIKESLVMPSLALNQVKQLRIGLVNFLIEHIREISGFTDKKKIMQTF